MRGAILLLVAGIAMATPAAADPRTTLDRDDSPGPLDLVGAKHSEFFTAQTHPEFELPALSAALDDLFGRRD